MMPPEISGSLAAVLMTFLVILGIAWLLLPFAMFGLKPRLDKLTEETRRTNMLLEDIRKQRG